MSMCLMSSELWHACAGPLVSLPAIGSRVVYFPQGYIEQVMMLVVTLNSIVKIYMLHSISMQVAASTNEEMASFTSLPCSPSQLVCQLHDVTMHVSSLIHFYRLQCTSMNACVRVAWTG